MSLEGYKDFSSLVSPERVHKACYSDEGVFEQGQYPSGIGEPATAVVPAAIANAIDDAVGARVRSLPITADAIKAAMA
tara:strand:- start:305 stop:538 length:234 start_codon:yes stop_codon:yes gene_type:complete